MAVTHPTAIRNQITDLVVGAIDLGGTETEGILRIQQATPSAIDLVDIDFALAAGPGAFGASAAGIATANSLPIEGLVGASGNAQEFEIMDCDSPRVRVCAGTVSDTGGAGDIKLSSIALTAGDYVRITALTYEAPN